jgi:adenylosuccinate lyase
LEIESMIHHDLMAELKTYAEQCPSGGGILHLGATSADIEDNADAIRQRQSLDILLEGLRNLLLSMANQIDRWADTPLMGYTHLQPAEPTTLGYRLAVYAQDLWMDWEDISRARRLLRGKGFKGAVGSAASYAELLGEDQLEEFEARLAASLGISFFPVTTQVYSRKQEFQILCALAGLGGSLYKFAFDLRLLQAPGFGEMAEPFESQQVGSSAMPFKRNPVNAEKIDSLARALAQLPRLGWDNAAHSLLERTLDDSANRRFALPEAFLITDELLITAQQLIDGLVVNEAVTRGNLARYGPFAGTERVLMGLAKAGADRQEMHERLRQLASAAWEVVQGGDQNPLADAVRRDPVFLQYLEESELNDLLDSTRHLGNAPRRARGLAESIRKKIKVSP